MSEHGQHGAEGPLESSPVGGTAGEPAEVGGLPAVDRRGPLAWMAENAVAANLLMLFLVVGGVLLAGQVKQEVFPEFDLDLIAVSIEYRGATPQDVEQGAVLAIEEAVRSLDGVREVRSISREGLGQVSIEMLRGARPMVVLNDVQSAVDRITSFPADAERPVVRLVNNRQQVLTLVLHGEAEEAALRELAEQMRDSLQGERGITLVELAGARPPEVHVEVDGETLRRHGLTHEQVAQVIRSAAVDLPAGAVRTTTGEVLLRIDERRERGMEFEDIVLLSAPDGTTVRLGDVATVRDDFRETDEATTFNGRAAARVVVYRVGNETPITVSEAVHGWMDRTAPLILPDGVELTVWQDMSEVYADRIGLLMKNAYLGLILVLLILGLFLDVKLAFWVTMGIPIAILGSLTLMPTMDVSFNMISLFAFILTLGIVVDDAIVVGEAVFKQRERGYGLLDAAIAGVREVGIPVVFSVLTTLMVFLPMLFLPGISGKFFGVIPKIVILVLIMSIVEALFILPAHLAHSKPTRAVGLLGGVIRAQNAFSRGFDTFTQRGYGPVLARAVQVRYLVIALGVAMLLVSFAFVGSGRVAFTFFPRVESDVVSANLRMPFGTPVAETAEVERRLVEEATALLEELGGRAELSRGVLATLGQAFGGMGPRAGQGATGSHISGVSVYLVPLGEREFTAAEFARRWRERVGDVAGVEALTFGFATGPSAGSPIDVELSHPSAEVLELGATALAETLREIRGVIDIDDGVSRGKEQLELSVLPAARSLGLTEQELGRQVRSAFFGSEAVRLQRGRDELRVFVRRPATEREREFTLETMMVRTPTGGELPLADAAELRRSRSYVEINRKDGRRLLSVTADVDDTVTTGNDVIRTLRDASADGVSPLDRLVADFPGLSWELGGEQAEQAETMGNLAAGFSMALLAMFGLLAVAFRSYVQPLIVLLAIPFGFIGAVGGHLLMGYSLSFMSMMGIVALSGVVVNSSLLLVVSANTYRAEGNAPEEAVLMAAVRRFRPVVLTALTTFFGLTPMILETSVQARFLIPMAISLGFGILFATFVTLFIVPSAYLVIEDIVGLRSRPSHRRR
ncbi:MAG: efflux RND transporter permease subunit [Deltaproteobacteria bacterium]|nr:MAG: efflux RND transporter permease subunit [Deltaproteobacteria bacterium]